VDILAAYQRVETGVHNWNASEGDYSFNVCLVMMTFDTALYIFLGWYLQLILPSSYGVPRPFYFCLLPSYWGCTRIQNLESEEDEVAHDTDENSFEIVGPEFGLPTVIIKDLVKRYSRAGPNAVDNLSLNLYENQITCLLGHNGAGKTSLISLLTGLFPATSGDCIIYNRRISNELDKVRESIGICPQHDIHFPELTVAEHLRLFEKIKGAKASSESVRKRANDVGLTEKLNALSGQLSGGMKRKLSIAIAMCGEPKFILLDEPTTGMGE
jgi:ABC-type lipoprotein export system ATPase subunit